MGRGKRKCKRLRREIRSTRRKKGEEEEESREEEEKEKDYEEK